MQVKRRPVSLSRLLIKPRHLLVVGVVLIGGSLQPTPVSAKSMQFKQMEIFSSLDRKSEELKKLDVSMFKKQEIVKEKKAAVVDIKEEAASIEAERVNIERQVQELRERIAWLSDMFVKPVKYSVTSQGNSYAPGNCTWYVKQKRPDIGNFWGNANSWYSSAAAEGFAVGTKPKVGAIAATSEGWAGHVAYVEKVSVDGLSVTISEMNYGGLYNMNTRTVPSSEFRYIYELK